MKNAIKRGKQQTWIHSFRQDPKWRKDRYTPINETFRTTLDSLIRRVDVPYVFYDPVTGKPYRDVKRSFNTVLKRAKTRDFHFHDSWRTFASHLVIAGIDLPWLKSY